MYKRFIYADNAATTKLDVEAFDIMKHFLLEDYSNASQPYSFSKESKLAIKEARKVIADCINAEPDEIFFTSGGSESDNWAIKKFGGFEKPKAIITSCIEHHAILNSCKDVQYDNKNTITFLPVDSKGIVQPEVLQKVITSVNKSEKHSIKLVSIMYANNEIGTIQPISELSRIAHNNGALFHTDAVQAVGHIPIDVKKDGIDMLSASAHKFNGPKGIGFMYIKKGTKILPYNNGGSQEYSMRAGTENVASIVGMAIALKNNCEKMKENILKTEEIENRFISKLEELKVDYIRNGADNHIPGNINISIKNEEGERLLHRLDLMGICVSTGSACDSTNTQVSHVIKAIGVPKEYAEGTIRISLNKDNSIEEAEIIADSIFQIINKK